jgi:hypothetical protein
MDERIASRLSSFKLLAFAGRDRRERKSHSGETANAH